MTAIPLEKTGMTVAPVIPHQNGSVTRDRYLAAARALSVHKSSSSMTWPEIAGELGSAPDGENYADSTLSAFASGSYPVANARNLVELVEAYIAEVGERQNLLLTTAFVPTSVSRRMLSFIKRGALMRKIIQIEAESGIGKSTTLRQYCVEHPRTVLISAHSLFYSRHQSTWPLLAALLSAANLSTRNGTSPTKAYQELVDKLYVPDNRPARVVIIDRAQFLTRSDALNLVACLNEDANCAIVLAGHETSSRKPSEFATHADYVAFTRRAITGRYFTKAFNETDVELVAAQLVGVDIAKAAMPKLLDIARGAGGMGQLVAILQSAQTLRDGHGKVLRKHVDEAISAAVRGDA
jgi:DNA transposition AAA+ family ATPase